ncbi:GNAT family N-acetyltransferase [Streptomyces sp. NPDC049040]|uniref:GNAT family N-acetyltransferase n=1 Tax=Streptomyces sp. NPDC049040 TaxID=3365593 RepID=UPI00372072C0
MGDLRAAQVELVAWAEADFWLLERANAAEMTEHLGGPESAEQLAARHRRYVAMQVGGMFRVVSADGGETVGSIGYWEREWRGGTVWETGWGVLPEFQGRGLAAEAAREVIAVARADGGHRWLHAFPGADHPASNAVCRKAGFEPLGLVDFEYPKGHIMTSNDWRVDLATGSGAIPAAR